MNKEAVKNMKPSAYRSMMMKKFSLNKSVPSLEKKNDLIRWKNERWINLTARLTDNKELPCGKKGSRQGAVPSVCRPKIKVNDKTPTPLADDINIKQLQKAIKIKTAGKRIMWKSL